MERYQVGEGDEGNLDCWEWPAFSREAHCRSSCIISCVQLMLDSQERSTQAAREETQCYSAAAGFRNGVG